MRPQLETSNKVTASEDRQRKRLFGVARSIAFLVLLVGLALWLSRSPQASVESITLTKALDDRYQPIDPTTTFGPDDPFFASVVFKNYRADPPAVARWSYEGKVITETKLLTDTYGDITAGFSLVNSAPLWPIGNYTIEIIAGKQVLATQSFTVAAPDK